MTPLPYQAARRDVKRAADGTGRKTGPANEREEETQGASLRISYCKSALGRNRPGPASRPG